MILEVIASVVNTWYVFVEPDIKAIYTWHILGICRTFPKRSFEFNWWDLTNVRPTKSLTSSPGDRAGLPCIGSVFFGGGNQTVVKQSAD